MWQHETCEKNNNFLELNNCKKQTEKYKFEN